MKDQGADFDQIIEKHRPKIMGLPSGPWFDQWYPECSCGWHRRGCHAMTIIQAREEYLNHLAEIYCEYGREPFWEKTDE